MGQKEIDIAYNPVAERIFLMSHPVHVGIVFPRKKDPLITEAFRLFDEGDHQRFVDFSLVFPHVGVIAQNGSESVATSPETFVSDFISFTFHKRGNNTGRLGYQDLIGLEGIVLITSPVDAQLVRDGLERGLKSEFSMIKDRITVVEVGANPIIDSEESLPYRHLVFSEPRNIVDLVDNMAELSIT